MATLIDLFITESICVGIRGGDTEENAPPMAPWQSRAFKSSRNGTAKAVGLPVVRLSSALQLRRLGNARRARAHGRFKHAVVR